MLMLHFGAPSMTPQQIVEKLISDNPSLHILSEEHADLLNSLGVAVKPGAANHAVPADVLRYIASLIKPDHVTIETGGGHSTVVFAALARHHTCVTPDSSNVELTREYLSRVGIPPERVTFIVEKSEKAIPNLPEVETFDFAFIDGNHAWPIAHVDFTNLDRRLKVGGIMGFDNIEIPAVWDLCMGLERNQTYRFEKQILFPPAGRRYGARFYSKLVDDGRETLKQPFNLRPARKLTLRERLTELRHPNPNPKFWPWDY